MRPIWFAIGLLLLLVLSISAQVSAQPQGRVIGTVLDEQGLPINEAQVCTQVNTPGESIGNCRAQTDTAGQFEMEHVPLGTFDVYASKSEDGYLGFDGIPGIQTVTLTPQAPLATVILRIGPKEGILAPSVKDKATGEPVDNFMLRWHVVPTGNWTNAGGVGFSHWTTRAAIPAEKDVVIDMVSARGYKKWAPADPLDPSRSLQLHLQRGEVKSLSFELEPEAKDDGISRR